MLNSGSVATTRFAPTITSTSGSCCRHVSQFDVGGVSVRRYDQSWWTVLAWMCCPGECHRLGSSPYLATDYTIYELCLPSECGIGMSLDLADPRSYRKDSGIFVSTAPAEEPAAMTFTVL